MLAVKSSKLLEWYKSFKNRTNCVNPVKSHFWLELIVTILFFFWMAIAIAGKGCFKGYKGSKTKHEPKKAITPMWRRQYVTCRSPNNSRSHVLSQEVHNVRRFTELKNYLGRFDEFLVNEFRITELKSSLWPLGVGNPFPVFVSIALYLIAFCAAIFENHHQYLSVDPG